MNSRTRISPVVSYALAVIGAGCLLLFVASTSFAELRFLRPVQSLLLVSGMMWPPLAITTVHRIRREQRRP